MSKPSKKRLGLLRLLADKERQAALDFPGQQSTVYLPAIRDFSLEKYGLSVWDNSVVTFAKKAGLIRGSDNFVGLTDEGRRVLSEHESVVHD